MIVVRICLLLSISAAAPINSNPDKKAAEEHFVSDDIVTADDGLHNHSSQNTGREERLVITGGNVHIESIGNITIMNTNFHNNHPGLSDSQTTQSAPSDSQNPESASGPGISETTQSAPGISQNHESASDPVTMTPLIATSPMKMTTSSATLPMTITTASATTTVTTAKTTTSTAPPTKTISRTTSATTPITTTAATTSRATTSAASITTTARISSPSATAKTTVDSETMTPLIATSAMKMTTSSATLSMTITTASATTTVTTAKTTTSAAPPTKTISTTTSATTPITTTAATTSRATTSAASTTTTARTSSPSATDKTTDDSDRDRRSNEPCSKICGGGCTNPDTAEGENICGGSATVKCNTQPCAEVSDRRAIKILRTTIEAVDGGLQNLENYPRRKRDLTLTENELKLLAIISEATIYIQDACSTKQSQCQLKTIEPFVEILTTIFNMIKSTGKCTPGFTGEVAGRKMAFDSVATVAEEAQTGWSNWSNYDECSEDCGGGKQTRTRTCNDLSCENNENTVETKDCNPQDCVKESQYEDMLLDEQQLKWLQSGLLHGTLGEVTVDETKGEKPNTGSDQKDNNAVKDPKRKWPNDIVYYSFDGTVTSYKKKLVRNTLSSLQEDLSSCLIFQERNHGNRIIVGTSGRGCWSDVGFKGKPQKLNLEINCWETGHILHEFLHAIGLYHTHCRSDRDDHITVIWKHIPRSNKHNFNKYNEKIISHYGLPYDFDSVMHYGGSDFSFSNKLTIETKDPKHQDKIGQRDGISSGDIKLVKLAYGYQPEVKCVISPNFPLKYPNKVNRKTTLSVAAGHSMRIEIHHFDVEKQSACKWDYLEFLDENSKSVGGKSKLCGKLSPKESFFISNSKAFAVFNSDSSGTRNGYKFCYYPVCKAGENSFSCFCKDESTQNGEMCTAEQNCRDGTCIDVCKVGEISPASCLCKAESTSESQVCSATQTCYKDGSCIGCDIKGDTLYSGPTEQEEMLNDVKSCAKMCLDTSFCKFWAWKRWMDIEGGFCQMKITKTGEYRSTEFISGNKACGKLGEIVDAAWSNWGDYGACSDPCGGTKTRKRTCNNSIRKNYGKDCSELSDECAWNELSCNEQTVSCSDDSCPGCLLEDGITYHSDNLPGYPTASSGEDECAKLCSKTEKCKVWVIWKPDNRCWLKYDKSQRKVDEGYISGTPGCSSRCEGRDSCCTSINPCGIDDGDCDINDDCQPGLVCGTDNCSNKGEALDDDNGWDRTDDCCTPAESTIEASSPGPEI